MIHRARKTKLSHVIFLGTSYLCLAAFYVALILREMNVLVLFTISTSIGQLGMILLYLFIIKVFFPQRPAIRKVMALAMILLAVLTSSFAIARDMPWQDAGMAVALRIMHTIFATLQISTASAFQASASLMGYRKFRTESVDRFVLFRYLLYGLSGFIMNAAGWLDLVGTVLSVLSVAEYEIIMIVQVVLIFAFSLFTAMVWVMPRKVKEFINKKQPAGTSTTGDPAPDEAEIMRMLEQASSAKE